MAANSFEWTLYTETDQFDPLQDTEVLFNMIEVPEPGFGRDRNFSSRDT
jgi:hypothetical protein